MSKSILVIDTPIQVCKNCRLCYECGEYDVMCAGTGKIIPDGEKPDWCPIRDCPEKLDENIEDYEESYYVGGWNDCIDEILKGENEE